MKPCSFIKGVLMVSLVLTCVVIGLTVSGRGVDLLRVDLLVPESFIPTVDKGTKLGVRTEWSLLNLRITNYVAHTIDKDIALVKLSEWATIYNLHSHVPAVAQVIQTIEKIAGTLRVTLTGSLYSFITAAGLYSVSLIFDYSRQLTPKFLVTPLLLEPGESNDEESSEMPLVIQECSQMSLNPGPANVYTVWPKTSIGTICNRLSLFIILLTCFILVMTIAVHYDDVQVAISRFLPILVKWLSLICITHKSDECQLIFTLNSFTYLLVGSVTTLFLATIISILACPNASLLIPV